MFANTRRILKNKLVSKNPAPPLTTSAHQNIDIMSCVVCSMSPCGGNLVVADHASILISGSCGGGGGLSETLLVLKMARLFAKIDFRAGEIDLQVSITGNGICIVAGQTSHCCNQTFSRD